MGPSIEAARFTPIALHRSLNPTLPPCPLLSPPLYRLNLLAAHHDVLYIAASSTEITRLRICRSNGPCLLNLTPANISPPTVVNNMRVAPFSIPPCSHSLLLTAGSEHILNSGKLVFLPLAPNASSSPLAPPVARAYSTDTHSAWGLAVHPFLRQIAISTNSYRSVIYSFRPTCTRRCSPPSSQPHQQHHSQQPQQQSFQLPTDVNHLQSLFHKHRFLLRQLHRNNLPSVSFDAHGHMLACASIDCTFSVQDLQASFRPWVFQSEPPVTSNFEFFPTRERCWQTHWILPSTVQFIAKHDHVWRFQSLQAKSTHTADAMHFPIAPIPSLFNRHHYAVRRTQTKVFYDDNQLLEEPSAAQSGPSSLPSHPVSFEEFENTFDASSFFNQRMEPQQNASMHASNHKPFFTKPVPISEPHATDVYAKGSLLLVCYERKLELHHVPSHREYNALDQCLVPNIQKLDTINLDPNLATLGVQIMFTNIVEVAPLRLLVCTAINTGVLLVRILRAVSESFIDKPCLFIERLISTNTAVAGTCVIERPGDNIAEYCAELWIFTVDGRLQCWELTQDGYAIDISTPL
eukprot:TRINITY_DN1161_c0_g1_i1.p1 TRINITY_DN1161_c0_g1~~TRINITY_DN1161_c0_g1_i1.p1  ORF type:complete len:576 (+),score=73.18 TRINITY_DN1161_c0_g1_i1:6358-8085(+)